MSAPLLLTVDTTSEQFGLAVSRAGQILDRRGGTAGRTLDIQLFLQLRDLLTGLGLDLGAIGQLAVCIGPGSFVGTRIGLCMVNSFAATHGLPVVGIGILPVLASLLPAGDAALAAVNCVRDEYFHQMLRPGPQPVPLGDVAVGKLADLADLAGGRPLVARSFGMGRKTASVRQPPPGFVPSYDQQLQALVTLATAAHASGAPSDLPMPLYVKSETART